MNKKEKLLNKVEAKLYALIAAGKVNIFSPTELKNAAKKIARQENEKYKLAEVLRFN